MIYKTISIRDLDDDGIAMQLSITAIDGSASSGWDENRSNQNICVVPKQSRSTIREIFVNMLVFLVFWLHIVGVEINIYKEHILLDL